MNDGTARRTLLRRALAAIAAILAGSGAIAGRFGRSTRAALTGGAGPENFVPWRFPDSDREYEFEAWTSYDELFMNPGRRGTIDLATARSERDARERIIAAYATWCLLSSAHRVFQGHIRPSEDAAIERGLCIWRALRFGSTMPAPRPRIGPLP